MAICNQVNWLLEFLKITPTFIIGLIAVYIAWRQWKTAQAKLNLDLFTRRLVVFDKTWGAASSVSQKPAPVYPPVDFTNLLPEASFLFGTEVEAYMRELMVKMNSLALIHQQVDLDDNKKNEVCELLEWINNAVRQGIRDIFSPYLNFGQWR